MIDRLRGTILRKNLTSLVLDVGGIGFDLHVPLSTLESLPTVGAQATVLISMLFRNDSLMLAGFATEAEREIFRLLIGVSGVGPRIALALLSQLGSQGVFRALQENDARAFARTPGVGKKLSERIALDLRDRVSHLAVEVGSAPLSVSALGATLEGDVVTALESLGFSRKESEIATARVIREEQPSDLPQAVRLALRAMGSMK